MSNKAPIKVSGAVISELPNSSKLLTLSTNAGSFEFEFTPARWEQLADTARWFEKHATTNGVHKEK